jgi:hypothetical protein
MLNIAYNFNKDVCGITQASVARPLQPKYGSDYEVINQSLNRKVGSRPTAGMGYTPRGHFYSVCLNN